MPNKDKVTKDKVTYWRSAKYQFSILYKGIVTEINRLDIGYGDLDRLDGIIHAAIGCKQKQECKEKKELNNGTA